MKTKIRVCIVGLGRAGHFHLHSIQQSPYFELIYIVDPHLIASASMMADSPVTFLADIERALEDPTLDAVIVSPPTQFHYQYIVRSLNAGKHVFAEKPLGKTIEEIEHCFDLAAQNQLALHLGFQRRYDTHFQDLKEKLPHLGQLRMIKTSSRDNPKPALDYLKISGNIFHDMLIHDFDMLLFLLGVKIPTSIFAYGHAYDPDIESIPDYDTVLVTIKYAGGLIVSIDTSRIAAYGYDQRIELFGEHGMAIAENVRDSTVQLHTKEGLFQSPINYSFPQRYEKPYALEIEGFAAGILNNRLTNVTKTECLLGHLIADAAHLAATRQSPIDFEAFLLKQKIQL